MTPAKKRRVDPDERMFSLGDALLGPACGVVSWALKDGRGRHRSVNCSFVVSSNTKTPNKSTIDFKIQMASINPCFKFCISSQLSTTGYTRHVH